MKVNLKKYLPSLFCILLLTCGCQKSKQTNFPEPPTTEAEPTTDVVSPTQEVIPTQTPFPEKTLTQIPPTQEGTPTQTPIPTKDILTQTPIPTKIITPTQTPSPTKTQSPTLTPTPIPTPILKDGEVSISAEVFPDENFRNYISTYIDTNNDHILSVEEIEKVEAIRDTQYDPDLNNEVEAPEEIPEYDAVSCIRSFEGIQTFYNLKGIYLDYMTDLDEVVLKDFPKLEVFYFAKSVKKITLENLPKLRYVEIYDEDLTAIQIVNTPSVETMILIGSGECKTIELNDMPKLNVLQIRGSNMFLEHLTLKNITNLSELMLRVKIKHNDILSIKENKNLNELGILPNDKQQLQDIADLLTSMNTLSKVTIYGDVLIDDTICIHDSNIEYIYFVPDVTKLELRNLNALTHIVIVSKLKEIEIQNCDHLEEFYLSSNSCLKTLDLSNLKQLKEAEIYSTVLETLLLPDDTITLKTDRNYKIPNIIYTKDLTPTPILK